MHYDVGGCVICISNKAEYLDKEESYDNSTKEVILSILTCPCNAIFIALDKISLHKYFKLKYIWMKNFKDGKLQFHRKRQRVLIIYEQH